MTQTTASLEQAVDEFRRVLPAATATAQAIDRREPWGLIALNAIDDGYVDFAAQLSAFFDDGQDDARNPAGEPIETAASDCGASTQPPTGMCPECGLVAFGLDFCGQCPTVLDGATCKGWIRSAVNDGDWSACNPCDGAGREGAADCAHCNGVGWLFMRQGGFDGTALTALPIIGRRR